MRSLIWTVSVVAALAAGGPSRAAQPMEVAESVDVGDGGTCNACGGHCGAAGNRHCGCGCHHANCKHCLCGSRNALSRAQYSPWHGGFYSTKWGAPVAVVVPPTAEYQTNWGWGVGNTRVSRINHQFQLGYPGAMPSGGYGSGYGYGFLPTPPWQSDSNQSGYYYVRGPW